MPRGVTKQRLDKEVAHDKQTVIGAGQTRESCVNINSICADVRPAGIRRTRRTMGRGCRGESSALISRIIRRTVDNARRATLRVSFLAPPCRLVLVPLIVEDMWNVRMSWRSLPFPWATGCVLDPIRRCTSPVCGMRVSL